MAVVVDHPIDDEHAAPIEGRPDFTQHRFGVTEAKRYPAYVFGIRGVSCLVHRVLRVELHWWRVGGRRGEKLVKLRRPVMIAVTACAYSFRLDSNVARTCHVPAPDALLCGRCHGEGATFRKAHRSTAANGLTRQEAHVKLGCAVKGY